MDGPVARLRVFGRTPAQVARIAICLCHFQNRGLGDEVVDSPSLRVREHCDDFKQEPSKAGEREGHSRQTVHLFCASDVLVSNNNINEINQRGSIESDVANISEERLSLRGDSFFRNIHHSDVHRS